jgi:hypothetical protein
MSYIAPYAVPAGFDALPEGEFLLPVCTTKERLGRLLNALNAFRNLSQDKVLDYQVDVLRALTYINRPDEAPCNPSNENDCIAYLPSSTRFAYAPSRPDSTDPVPSGYPKHPFYTVNGDNITDPLVSALGVQIGDVIVDATTFLPIGGGVSIFDLIAIITQSGLPRIRIPFQGRGQVEIELLKIPQGGMAYITTDGNPFTAQWVDLTTVGITEILTIIGALDDFLFGGGLITTDVIEIDFTTGGSHYIDITFVPKIDVDVLLGFGGGIREIRFCGEEIPCGCEDDLATFRLRQNEENLCQLQQSFDGGLTWSLAFDYSKCRPRPSNIEINNFNQTIINQYTQIMNTYNDNGQTVALIAPSLVYNGNEEQDAWRDTAICVAIHDLVDWACEIEIEKRQDTSLIAGLSGAVLGIIGALMGAGIIIGTAGTGLPLLFGIGGTVIGASYAVWGELSSDLLENQDARKAVACCIADYLEGQTPTKNVFADAVGTCNFPFGSYEAQLAAAISGVLERDDVHATFLAYAQDNYNYAKLGLIECPCGDEWEHTFDFTLASLGFEEYGAGVYVAGVGFKPSLNPDSTYLGFYRNCGVGTQLTSWRIEINDIENNGLEFGLIHATPVPNFTQETIDLFAPTAGDYNQSRSIDFVMTKPYIGFYGFSPFVRSDYTIKRLTLSGTGVNPFV